jgi:formate dehydrogenase subunit gamma
VVAGHILFALSQPQALRGMLTGRVARRWAQDHHPRWARGSSSEPRREGPRAPYDGGARIPGGTQNSWTSASG